jgi:hypothetical protein
VLAPVAAQQTTSRDGQVALRSDGAVYLLLNGQRRWVAPLFITDEQLNALREGEPIYAGLVPADSGFAPQASTPSSSQQSREQAQSNATRTPTPTRSSSSQSSSSGNDNGSSSDDVAIEEITYDEDVRQGDDWRLEATVSQQRRGRCELEVEWPDQETDEDDKAPDADGICVFTVEAPSNVKTGTAKWTLVFRDGDKRDEDNGEFKVNRR